MAQPVSKRFLYSCAVLAASLGILLFLHLNTYVYPVSIARENVLKQDLQIVREAIDNYTLDRKSPPRTLQDLADAHYIRKVPVDPITHAADWQLHFADVQVSPALTVNGIDDIHSASHRTASDGTRYDTW